MVQFDPVSIAQRVENRLKAKSTHQDILFFGANKRLIEAFAEELSYSMGTFEYYTREAKWALARNVSSIQAQSSFYNYKPHRKIGASGEVFVSTTEDFNGDYPESVTVEKYDQFSNGSTYFVASEQSILLPGQEKKRVPVVQGAPRSQTFNITAGSYPNGTDYLTLTINNKNMEENVYDVFVNGVRWTEIDLIRLADTGDQLVYTVKNANDFSSVSFKFGNNVFGKRVEYGDTVEIKYVETKGADGNILTVNNITIVEKNYTDAVGNPVDLYVRNEDVLTGGQGYETIESIRARAPQKYKTGNRPYSTEDYITFILDTGLVDRVIVWGEKEINEDRGNPPGTYLPLEENLVYISGFTINATNNRGTPITAANQSTIRDELNEVKSPTDILQFIETEFIYVVFHTTAYVTDRTFSDEEVIANIQNDLSQEYGLDETSYRQNLYFSEYHGFITNVAGVRHHRTDLSFAKFARFTSAYEFFADIGLSNIKPFSVKLYVRIDPNNEWTHIATDDGANNLIGEEIDSDDSASGTYTLPNATINYTDGFIGDVIVTFGLNEFYAEYEIKIEFELDGTENGNLVLNRRQQIFSYLDAEVNVVRET